MSDNNTYTGIPVTSYGDITVSQADSVDGHNDDASWETYVRVDVTDLDLTPQDGTFDLDPDEAEALASTLYTYAARVRLDQEEADAAEAAEEAKQAIRDAFAAAVADWKAAFSGPSAEIIYDGEGYDRPGFTSPSQYLPGEPGEPHLKG